MRLHFGCGTVDLPGFINIDATPHPNVHFLRDVTAADVWPTESADLIYACHVLEHVPWAKIPNVLARWRAILRTGGVLRLSVPDFDVLVERYRDSGDLGAIIPILMGGQCDPHDYHCTVFNASNLESQLREVGFSEVRRWEPDDQAPRDYSSYKVCVAGQERYLSVNLEAVK